MSKAVNGFEPGDMVVVVGGCYNYTVPGTIGQVVPVPSYASVEHTDDCTYVLFPSIDKNMRYCIRTNDLAPLSTDVIPSFLARNDLHG